MAKKTNLELVKFCYSKLGTPYVYGMKGSVLTVEKYNQLRALYGDLVWKSDFQNIGKVVCDCSGLISWCTGIQRGSQNFHDTAKKVHPISTISSAPIGVAVWQKGHIGVYIGNGEYIAEDGSAYGCRQNKLSNAKFTHWFEIIDIDYVSEKEEEEVAEKIYNWTKECPTWAQPTVQKLLNKKYLVGNEKGELGLTDTMLKLLVINDRAKLYD